MNYDETVLLFLMPFSRYLFLILRVERAREESYWGSLVGDG